MSSVFKSLSKTNEHKNGEVKDTKGAADSTRRRVLLLSSRGTTYRHRHLLSDLYALLPHSRKDSKLDTKTKLYQLNELADLHNCNYVMFFEARKAKDLYLWLCKAPNGPTVKMHLHSLYTMSELHFEGNCLKGSRPILSFDAKFDTQPHLIILKELLSQAFGVPKSSRKIKPFVDHVMGFTIADNKIWVRCYEIKETDVAKGVASQKEEKQAELVHHKGDRGETEISLREIGPRFVLTPIVILESSFGGPVIYENKEFVSPNQIRSDLRRAKAGRYATRNEDLVERKAKHRDLGLRTGEARRKRVGEELESQRLFA